MLTLLIDVPFQAWPWVGRWRCCAARLVLLMGGEQERHHVLPLR